MPRGYPDWNVKVTSLGHYETDVNELAVRLGYIGSYNRSGKVLYFHKFEDGLGLYATNSSKTGAECNIIFSPRLRGNGCLELLCGTGAGGLTSVTHTIPGVNANKLGLEIIFSGQNEDEPRLVLQANGYSNEGFFGCGIKVRPDQSDIQYVGSDGGLASLESIIDIYEQYPAWHSLKFVIDLETGYYSYLLWNDIFIDMSDIQYQKSPSSEGNIINFFIGSEQIPSGSNASLYVDSIIITADES